MQVTGVGPRNARSVRHFGGSLGVTIWEITRHVYGRPVLIEITHDAALRTTTVRTYPGAGWTPPTHEFVTRDATARDIGARLYA